VATIAADPSLAARLTSWAREHLDQLIDAETRWNADGPSLVHGDLSADNVLLTNRGVVFLLWDPAIRSPSQWPGTARSLAWAGRSRMDTASRICPRPCPAVEAVLTRRIVRRVRRCAVSSLRRTPLACTNRLR